jgi:uncharacterized NAD-dependent epimerase/dehydratase family protein
MNITREQMLDWLYQAIAMKRRGDGLRVIADGQWNADMRSAIRSLIESSGEKAVPASNRLTVQYANAPTIKKDLTVEVEEAMETLTMLVKVDGDVLENAALAVIRAALSKGIEVEP